MSCCCCFRNKNSSEQEVVQGSAGRDVAYSSEMYETVEVSQSGSQQTTMRPTPDASTAAPVTEPPIYRQTGSRNTARRSAPHTSNTAQDNLYRSVVRNQPIVVAAIDFGTTFSTWAFGFVSDLQTDPSKMFSGNWRNGQAPTCLLLRTDERVYYFGYEAEDTYKMMTREELNGWYYFQRFKMSLYGEEAINERSELVDVNGKRMAALKVFRYCIQYMKDHLLDDLGTRLLSVIRDQEIQWVLTLPAIWDDTAKRFMRKSAEMAGIAGHQLMIALEPEAASVYCRTLFRETPDDIATRHPIELQPGSSYIVLDAGGGTIDIAVHRILDDNRVEEVYQSSGGPWGGNTINQKFVELLCDVFGEEKMDHLRREYIEDHTDLMYELEVKKKEIDSQNHQNNITVKIPIELQRANTTVNQERDGIRIVGDKIRISKDRVKELFNEALSNICDHLAELFENDAVSQCEVIMMVGGFSDCKLLQNAIEETFPRIKPLIPKDAGMAIVKGAVLFGYKPTVVTQRVCKLTYGEGVSHRQTEYCNHPDTVTMTTERGTYCNDIFAILATKGTPIKVGECTREVSGPSLDDGDHVTVMLFASPRERPYLVTEDDCFGIGQFRVPVSNGRESKIGVRLMFGGTEIQVIAEDKDTGIETTHSLQYL